MRANLSHVLTAVIDGLQESREGRGEGRNVSERMYRIFKKGGEKISFSFLFFLLAFHSGFSGTAKYCRPGRHAAAGGGFFSSLWESKQSNSTRRCVNTNLHTHLLLRPCLRANQWHSPAFLCYTSDVCGEAAGIVHHLIQRFFTFKLLSSSGAMKEAL